jgi:hypothetical protein
MSDAAPILIDEPAQYIRQIKSVPKSVRKKSRKAA